MKTKNTLHIWLVLCLVTGFLLYAASLTHAESLPFSLDTEYAELDGHPAAVLWVTPQKGYHTYSHYADAPIPTSLNVRNVQGQPAAAAVLYPQGRLTPDTFEPAKQILAYTARFPIFTVSMPPYGPLSADLSMLLCSDKNMCPRTANGFPGTPRNAASAESSPHWRRMGNSVKPKHPPPLPNPFLRKPPHSNPSPS